MFFKRLLFDKYLEKGETLYYTIHRHWITISAQMFRIGFFGYLIPLFVLVFLTGLSGPASFMMYGWIAIAFLYSIYAFIDWYLDAWLITDVSIINTRWDGFLKQSSSRVDYESIESVDIKMEGIKQSLLNYGKISLIRSSTINVTMDSVHNPQKASSWISKVRGDAMLGKNVQDAESLKSLLADIIEERIKVKS